MISKEKKLQKKIKQEMIWALPSFINQLLLLLTSGVVISEAMVRIAVNYKKMSKERQNIFTLSYIRIYENSVKTGESMLSGFYKFGIESRIKEVSRVAGIIWDGGKRGNDLWMKLADEGEVLWEVRKQDALEKIRLSESRMSFPLALVLMALIIITAAPAMLQMYIN